MASWGGLLADYCRYVNLRDPSTLLGPFFSQSSFRDDDDLRGCPLLHLLR